MSCPLFVVAADCHVEELIWRDKPSLRGDGFHGFSQCVDIAIELNVPLVLAGDIVETLPARTPTSLTVTFLSKQLRRMARAELPVYAIHGQHDRAFPSWMKAIDSSVVDSDGSYVTIGNRRLYMAAWQRKDDISKLIADIRPGTDILVSHQHWQELMGGSCYEASASTVPHVSMIISGDYHKLASSKSAGATGNNITLYSPGATHMRKINEPVSHSVLIVNDDLTVTQRKLASRVVLQAVIDSQDDIVSAIECHSDLMLKSAELNATRKLPPALHKPIYIIRDRLNDGTVSTRMSQIIGDSAYLFYYCDATVMDVESVPFTTQEFNGEADRLGYFLAKECEEGSDEFALLKKLLTSDDAKSDLASARAMVKGY